MKISKKNIEKASNILQRLEYLRGELRAERISTGELLELQSLASHIAPGDVELLEAAGVPEHPEASHTPGAMRCAEIIIAEGIDRRGRTAKIKTAFGEKTREGIADLIDRETGATELLRALEMVARSWDQAGQSQNVNPESPLGIVRAAIAKARGGA